MLMVHHIKFCFHRDILDGFSKFSEIFLRALGHYDNDYNNAKHNSNNRLTCITESLCLNIHHVANNPNNPTSISEILRIRSTS